MAKGREKVPRQYFRGRVVVGRQERCGLVAIATPKKQAVTKHWSVAKEVAEVVEKGEKAASELGEESLAYLNPLKEKFANQESLKESPEELKQAVTDLIQEIEGKAEDLQLPEKMSSALATVKEKLVALKDYLEGDIDQAKISEHIQGIVDTVKSELVMTKK